MALDPDSVATPGTADWWLIYLGNRLDADRGRFDQLHAYDCGNHPLPQGHARARDAYRNFQRQARTNFTGLVTESVLDRLQVTGFRMGGQADLQADEDANQIWQDSYLDADATIVMRDALVMGRAYVIVGPSDSPSKVMLTCEDPRQVIHEPDPIDRRQVRAALKTWIDDVDRQNHAVVYLPDTINYYVAPRVEGVTGLWTASRWSPDVAEGDDGVAPNPLDGTCPVVPFINRPEKDRNGFGEFQDVTDVQDRINQHVLDRLVTSATQAFRQRWATGAEGSGSQFDPGADLLWWVEDPDARFGDFTQSDLRMFIDAIRADVEHLASITRTPPYYLLGQMANLSGDALTAAEAGLVAKARRRMAQFGESWEQVMALSFELIDRPIAIDAETIWADPERRNEAASADAAVKKKSVGVPWRQLMEDLGYSPQQIQRMEALQTSDALRERMLAPPVPPIAPAGAQQPPPAGTQTQAPAGAQAGAGAQPEAA